MEKAKNAVEEAAGKVKETVGKVTGEKDTEHEGQADQSKADLKQAGENAKDAVSD